MSANAGASALAPFEVEALQVEAAAAALPELLPAPGFAVIPMLDEVASAIPSMGCTPLLDIVKVDFKLAEANCTKIWQSLGSWWSSDLRKRTSIY